MDLIPNGSNIFVTDENKTDYVRYIAHHRMTTSFRKQIDAFLEGFHQCVPSEAISIFDPSELELLISGTFGSFVRLSCRVLVCDAVRVSGY